MSTIVTRAGKGSPLTNDEVDANFNNLNSTKLEVGGAITVKDNVFTLQDDVDPTKQAQFQLGNITTATTRSYTLPNNDTVLAGLSGTETFSGSKTFSGATNVFGSSSITTTQSLGSGATTTGNTKTVNVGTGGVSGSTTNITVGSANGSTTTLLGTTVIGGAAGNQSLQVNNVASAVNYTQITGGATGVATSISSQGFDTDVGLNLTMKGWNAIKFNSTTGGQLFQIGQSTATTATFFQSLGNATGSAPIFSSQGSEANIGFSLQTKGTGSFNFSTGGGRQTAITDTASAVNYLNFTGAATGAAPTISAQGSDANINLTLSAKNTGFVSVTNGSGTATRFFGGVNFIDFSGGGSGSAASLVAAGADANIAIRISGLGTGVVALAGTSLGGAAMQIKPTTSSVNYLQTTGAVTTGAPELSAQGSDTNIDLKLTPKGTGSLTINATTAVTVPAGTTAQRPTGVTGMFRYNTTTPGFEGYNGTTWGAIGGGASASAITINTTTVSANTTIAAGNNGFSVGPIVVNSGATVTVTAGQRWVVI